MLENVTATSQALIYKARIELTAKPTDEAKLLCAQLCCAILQSLNGTVNDVPHLASIVPTCTKFFDEELQMFIGCFSALAQPPNSFSFAFGDAFFRGPRMTG